MDANEADFEDKVIARSREVPVVVDFWAEWCGPCRTLGPLLEREVAALGGKVELIKIDTDNNPRLAQRYQIRGIPAVKAFKDGKVVDEFVGAQPLPTVRAFLQSLSPSEEELAAERRWVEAVDKLKAGTLDQAALDGIRDFEKVEVLQRLLDLFAFASDAAGPDLEAKYARGASLAKRGLFAEALEQFLEVVTTSRKFRDDAGRRAMLALFDHPLIDPELVREYRRRLQIVT
jgi:putative thioredoxin